MPYLPQSPFQFPNENWWGSQPQIRITYRWLNYQSSFPAITLQCWLITRGWVFSLLQCILLIVSVHKLLLEDEERGILYDPYQIPPERLKRFVLQGLRLHSTWRQKMCLDLIKCATNCDENLQEKKNYPARCFFSSRWTVDGWLSQTASCCLGNMETKFSTHQPSVQFQTSGWEWDWR